jgi:hypothetical protein
VPEGTLIDSHDQFDDAHEAISAGRHPEHGWRPDDTWSRLAFAQYQELGMSLRSSWDIYIKFFTVFITFNVIAIGAVVERVDPINRPLMAAAFIAQNLLASGTALGLAWYTKKCRGQLERIADVLLQGTPRHVNRAVLREAPIPGTTGVWAGIANFIAHVSLIGIWILVARM